MVGIRKLLFRMPLAVAVVLAFPASTEAQVADARLLRVPAADVDVPQSSPDRYAPTESRRVCFEPGRYVLVFRAADGDFGLAAIGPEGEDGEPVEGGATGLYGVTSIIGTDDAQRWNWGSFTAISGTCHVLIVSGAGARARVYDLRIGVSW